MQREAARPLLISILNWNGLDDTLACLRQLAAGADGLWDVLVTDNGSRDDGQAAIAAAFPAVQYRRLPHNLGFAGGQNAAIGLALQRGYQAVLLLNNDCRIDARAIRAMWQMLAADSGLAAVSPLLYCSEAPARPQMVAGWLDWGAHCSRHPSTPTPAPAGMPTMLPGTALLLRSGALQTLGLLDERYFAYYEDNDLCARIAAQGWRAAYCPQAQAWHASRPVHGYSALALYLSARNAWLFWRAHTPARQRRGLFRHLLAHSLQEITLLKKAGAQDKCAAVVAGFWDAQRGRFGPPPAQLASPALLRWLMCHTPYLVVELLRNPRAALAARLRRAQPVTGPEA